MKKNLLLCAFLLATTLSWSQNVPRRMVCLEIETSTRCTYCPGAAMGAEDMLANGKQVAVVENHCNGLGNDPYSNVGARSRETLYNAPAYPTSSFDGVSGIVGGSHSSTMYTQFLAKYNPRISVTSPIDIAMEFTNTGLQYNVTVTVTKVGTVTGTLKLFFFVTESNIVKNWQGQHWLHSVNRLMVPDKNGTPVDFTSGDVQTYNLTLTMDAAWVINNCEFVATVQNIDASQGTFNGGGYQVNKREEIQTIKSGLIPLTVEFTTTIDSVNVSEPVTFAKDVFGGYVNTNQTYEWIFEGGTPATSTDSMCTVTYAHGGSYDVTLIVNRGGQIDTLVKPDFVYVFPGVGMQEKDQPQMSVYPNPTNGNFAIEINLTGTNVVDLKVINATGTVVYRENGLIINGNLVKSLSLSDLSSGVYFVQMENKSMKVSQKIIVR